MLLRLPAASIGELAAGLNMSMMDVRSALSGLEDNGLVGRLPGPAHRFRAEPPDRAADAVLVWPSGLSDTLAVTSPLLPDAAGLPDAAASEEGNTAADVPTPEDLTLLRLLLDGLTDQAIAGRLGIGERTVQRRVRDLIDLVACQTRLQLIWQATQRGWI
jgi:DNA-binding CsgD family transcriptional regulator